MDRAMWPRLGAASGMLFVILLLGGESIPFNNGVVEFVGLILFIPFVGYLFSVLRRAEGGDGWLSATALGAGMISSAMKLASGGEFVAARGVQGIGGTRIEDVLVAMNDGSFMAHMAPLGVMVGAASAVIIKTRVLPVWLGLGGRTHRLRPARQQHVRGSRVRSGFHVLHALDGSDERHHDPTRRRGEDGRIDWLRVHKAQARKLTASFIRRSPRRLPKAGTQKRRDSGAANDTTGKAMGRAPIQPDWARGSDRPMERLSSAALRKDENRACLSDESQRRPIRLPQRPH
jgi:hypothetical protein